MRNRWNTQRDPNRTRWQPDSGYCVCGWYNATANITGWSSKTAGYTGQIYVCVWSKDQHPKIRSNDNRKMGYINNCNGDSLLRTHEDPWYPLHAIKYTVGIEQLDCCNKRTPCASTRSVLQRINTERKNTIQYVHTYMLARAWFTAQVFPLPSNCERQINTTISWFSWRGGGAFSECQCPPSNGTSGMKIGV
jgi:hypothetical protein